MSVTIPAEILNVLRELLRVLGSTFTMELLINRISMMRDDQPIRIEEDTQLPPGLFAYTTPLADCDLICLRPGLGWSRRYWLILHELAHILLGHVDLAKGDPNTATYAEFVRNRDLSQACYKGGVQRDPERERKTDMLAALLSKILTDGEQSFVDNIFGKEM